MERSKRNKSRQSHKSRSGGNLSETGNGGFNQSSGTSNPDQSGFHQLQQSLQQQQQQSGGLVRSKPCREIYRPPNCRKGRNNNQSSNSGQHYQNYYSYNNNVNSEKQHNAGNTYDGVVKSSSMNTQLINNNTKEITSPELIASSSSSATANVAQGFRPLNIHAKEFHFKPTSVSETEDNINKSPYYGIVSTTAGSNQSNPPSSAGPGTTFYSLCQSKSSGNVTDLKNSNGQFEDGYGNVNAQTRENTFDNVCTSNSGQYFNPAPGRNIPRLQQSKSSGNIPTRSKVVHFVDDGNVSPSRDEEIFDQLLNSTNALNLRGENNFTNSTSEFYENEAPSLLTISQPRIQFLQKSRTTIQMGIGTMSNQMSNYFFRNPQQQRPSGAPNMVFLPPGGLIRSPTVLTPPSPQPSQLKRSKSFCVKSSGNKNSGNYGGSITAIPNSPNFGDFCINKWPRAIQESITSAVTGGDRIPPRHRINMVSNIFETLFELNTHNSIHGNENGNSSVSSGIELNHRSGQNGNSADLITPAVQIFLYFIQREKDHTVMESLLNTCFAVFQSLSTSYELNPGSGNTGGQAGSTKYKWNVFLSFLCSFYCQVKCIRVQHQSSGSSIDQISMTVLTLLCDSCHATLRSLPICHSPETMDCLFTVMTSIGRDMEKTFPFKMKQILTSIRDALLGLGPYSALTEAPPVVQKTLMQLIELHAANWHLPASAVRYYYAHPTSSSNSEQITQNR